MYKYCFGFDLSFQKLKDKEEIEKELNINLTNYDKHPFSEGCKAYSYSYINKREYFSFDNEYGFKDYFEAFLRMTGMSYICGESPKGGSCRPTQ